MIKKYQFALGKTDKGYRLDAGVFPPGNYKYEASVKIWEKQMKAKGNLVVSEIRLESINSMADHQLLRTLSSITKGQFYSENSFSEIAQVFLNNPPLKPTIYNYSSFDEAIHLKWILALLVLLLTIEWFIRKWGGAY